jgi:hypothetical protein
VAEATGSNLPPYGALVLVALRGDEEASASALTWPAHLLFGEWLRRERPGVPLDLAG